HRAACGAEVWAGFSETLSARASRPQVERLALGLGGEDSAGDGPAECRASGGWILSLEARRRTDRAGEAEAALTALAAPGCVRGGSLGRLLRNPVHTSALIIGRCRNWCPSRIVGLHREETSWTTFRPPSLIHQYAR